MTNNRIASDMQTMNLNSRHYKIIQSHKIKTNNKSMMFDIYCDKKEKNLYLICNMMRLHNIIINFSVNFFRFHKIAVRVAQP